MKNKTLYFLMLIFGFTTVISCSSNDDNKNNTKNMTLDISGLQDLGSDFIYENWIIVDGDPVSAGTLSVSASGELSQTSHVVDANNLDSATAFVLTIEPNPDPDPAPSNVHILAGDFLSNASLTTVSINHGVALGTDLTEASGDYLLGTPTDEIDTNEKSGIWWLVPEDNEEGDVLDALPTLTLPTLPTGWKYEGWVVIGTTPVSTGKFTTVIGADDPNTFSGLGGLSPEFPGEEFLMAAPSGLTFPTDLSGQKVVISVEPDPDNSPNPFLLKPLIATVPVDADEHTLYGMTNNATATNPSGSVTR